MNPFQRRGLVSQRDACITVFRSLGDGEWLPLDEVAHRMTVITGVDCDATQAHRAGWSASQSLAKEQEAAVVFYRDGYKRLRADEQVHDTKSRVNKFRRVGRRTTTWIGNALANDGITGPDRHELETALRVRLAQEELDKRRNQRRRPAPVGEAAPRLGAVPDREETAG